MRGALAATRAALLVSRLTPLSRPSSALVPSDSCRLQLGTSLANAPPPSSFGGARAVVFVGAHSGARLAWTGTGGPDRGDGSRVGRHDERPPPPPICEACHRRFCACEDKPPTRPPLPGPDDCCQSAPQCKFCVWIVHDQLLAEYRAHVAANPDAEHRR